ncbi:NPC intracellular cholesterol transporter 2 homolog a-like [Zeugodacus cucurbitae]|uniref:NPC intracellular cholesterol transporter 2 homolog a-like n=1 Tax=Zeugodacus cucurbitae TaxID=28588 RepID=UPI0023D9096B|nr:NPC intracellular cholesterol transporter 2 homolog a-like [Zeugodacus cucurbitae]
MFRLTIVCLALFLASVSATNVRQCKNGRPFPLSVEIVGCDKMPCNVVKGSTAVMKVNFVGTRDNIRSINAVVHATALGITAPYPLPADVADVCRNLLNGASCPIDESEDVVYNFNFYIDPSYPEVSVKVELDLVDEYKESIACFVTDIKVQRA